VAYRHHPLAGRCVEVLRRRKQGDAEQVVITLPDETRCVLPAWMLDPVHCDAMPQEPHPRVALAALKRLRALLDAQSWFQ
jgi:hypothetical protein